MLGDGKQSRLDMFEARYPEPPEGEILPEIWNEAGALSFRGDGKPIPLTWAELEAFVNVSGHSLSPLAMRTLHAMSVAYVAGLMDNNPLSIAPSERQE
jgi:hypothetical protein